MAMMSGMVHDCTTRVKPTVLVVDDEAGPRDALKVILRPFFDILSAENAKAALEILNERPVDLITLDQKLPDRPGIDLLQEIKQDYADTEVIIVTGYGSLKSAMEGIRHGAAGYLLKPFNVIELITLINQTLGKKHRLDFIRQRLQRSSCLWGTEQESLQAWQSLRAGYVAIGNAANEEKSTPAEPQDLLPFLSEVLEAKDRQLLNHSSRVSFYATLLANRLNLSVLQQKSLAMGAFLHDFGKISVALYRFSDDQVLPSGEAAACLDHPDAGARMILSLGLSAEIGQIVSYHHERWDGSGYPHGLEGEGIPLLARIVCIAQAFDHLTAETAGRSPMSFDEATRQISAQAYTRFDPVLAKLFAEVVEECKASLPSMVMASAAAEF
jgi:putative two-component system response regulator